MRKRHRLPPEEYHALCQQMYERDKWACQVCKYRQNLHAHHVIYRSQGGLDELDNLITLCVDCHDAVHKSLVTIHRGESGFIITRSTGWFPVYKVK